MKDTLNYEVLKKWTNLKNKLKSKASQLKKENDSLRFKVNLLLVLIGSGLVYWLATE